MVPHATSTVRPFGLLILLICLVLLSGRQSGARTITVGNAVASTDDRITTYATVAEGDTVRSVILKPFRPLEYLKYRHDELPKPNQQIIAEILKYPRTGQHDYWWPRKGESAYDGSTTDIVVNNTLVMKGEPKANTFCCGLTLEVCYKLLEKSSARHKFDSRTGPAFKRLWFCENLNSPGPLDALTSFSLGRKVEFKDALAGDFMQLWRMDKSGHSVVFIAWAFDQAGNWVGVHYWSTQPGTKGINFNTELFGRPLNLPPNKKNKGIDPANTTLARLNPL